MLPGSARPSQATGGGDRVRPSARLSSLTQPLPSAEGSPPMAKYVYSFGGGKADGDGQDEGPARRQGGQPGRNDQHRPARAGRLHHHAPKSAPTTTPTTSSIRPNSKRQVDDGHGQDRRGDGRQVRRHDQPAAGLLPLGRPRVDARHDGHRAQHRPQRQDGRGAGQAVGQRAVRLGQLSPLRADVRRRRART